jgi:DSF synthase
MLLRVQNEERSGTQHDIEVDISELSRTSSQGVGQLWPELGQLECAHDISNATLWSFMAFKGRPSYNPGLLVDFHHWQTNIKLLKAIHPDTLKYIVLGSRQPGVFCFGGDLDYFLDCIARGDRNGLAAYGLSCIQILHQNWKTLDSDLITIGLAQGDALGGGFESLLSFDIICAEKGAKFGFPEQLFGLFPGMGALSFLGRKLGFAKAEWLVRSGKTMTAEQLYELGLVHILAEPGEGVTAVNRYIQKNISRHGSHLQMHRASKRANPIPFEELSDIVWLWVEACLQLEDHNMQVMRRLVGAQSKMGKVA